MRTNSGLFATSIDVIPLGRVKKRCALVGPEQLKQYLLGNVLESGETLKSSSISQPPKDFRNKLLGERPFDAVTGWCLILLGAGLFTTSIPTGLFIFATGTWMAGTPWRRIKRIKNTFYAVTDRRVLKMLVGKRVQIDSLARGEGWTVEPVNSVSWKIHNENGSLTIEYALSSDLLLEHMS